MGVSIRQAVSSDVNEWLSLLHEALGKDYVDPIIYDPAWVMAELDPQTGHETWVAELEGKIQASLTFLQPSVTNRNPVANLGRILIRPSGLTDGSVDALLTGVGTLLEERRQIAVARVLASDHPQQVLFEKHGYVCTGFQPSKHIHRTREGVLFYVWFGRPDLLSRWPVSESLSQVSELATLALDRLGISHPITVSDGVTGYSLKSEAEIFDASHEQFEVCRSHAESANPAAEISGGQNLGTGLMREPSTKPVRALLAQRGEEVVAGLGYFHDELDRCVRVAEGFCTDDQSLGVLLSALCRSSQENQGALYVEVDILMTSPRLLKSAEQLGFVPVAYFPAFFAKGDRQADVVKMVKLNMAYSLERVAFTAHAQAVVDVIDRSLQDQKVGVAIINLLRGLPIFEGLGDGELRKVSRLFSQKLFRPGERVFNRGDQGSEAYVVMRGQVDVLTEENGKLVASITSGQILGELAFLEGTPRTALAVASQASILLLIQRSSFNELVQREPHLGMVVIRNIAVELSRRLRRSNDALSVTRGA